MKRLNYLAVIFMITIMSSITIAQELPKPSPAATVEQRIGLTDISVTYSRPSVKGRVIWGELVPYDKVWRTGANASTLITFSDDVKIEGQDLKAGTYALFVTPTKTDWQVVLNSKIEGWGTSDYKKENDLVTVKVKPGTIEMLESMRFSFENLTNTQGNLVLSWGKVSISLKIEVDVDKKAWANIDKAIAEAIAANKEKEDSIKLWKIYRSGADYCADSKSKLDQGMEWINKSIELHGDSWYSYWIKADVQYAKEDKKGAIKSIKKALELGEAKAKEEDEEFSYKERLEKVMEEYKKNN